VSKVKGLVCNVKKNAISRFPFGILIAKPLANDLLTFLASRREATPIVHIVTNSALARAFEVLPATALSKLRLSLADRFATGGRAQAKSATRTPDRPDDQRQNFAMNAGTAAEATMTYHGRIESPPGSSCQPVTSRTKKIA
jgi:hypothetical protein